MARLRRYGEAINAAGDASLSIRAACGAMLADRVLTGDEADAFGDLCDGLGISPEERNAIVAEVQEAVA